MADLLLAAMATRTTAEAMVVMALMDMVPPSRDGPSHYALKGYIRRAG